ncbi:hypothetical protein BOTCAL_0276g00160 [Botryotinia calthae]|uniref:Uncharacterized protein n=1 Tax=Botryotinia calthae TaxID=38488 RepID=A0A4Y8CVG5_9HELO|nr:hypothetical protein BOTCAL_0276g00160 [Botryotinia calthae]
MQYGQINNDYELDSIDFSFYDHGIDLQLHDPSTVSGHGSRNSQYSVTNSLLSISTQPEPSQCSDSHSDPSTAQNTKLNLPIQSSQNGDSSTVDKSADTVVWKVDWQQPTFMCSMLLSGLVLAIGHHVYYNSLNGTPAGNSTRQNWSIRFGTAFASLVVVCFKAVTVSALGQYFWTVVRAKGLRISDLDKLYALTSSPTGMFSFSVIKNTTLAAAIGMIFWYVSTTSSLTSRYIFEIQTDVS